MLLNEIRKRICKNCKHYSKNEFYDHYGDCDNEKFEYNNYWTDNVNKSEFPKDKFLYEDYEGYSADFVVVEEFGCIHFEEKVGEEMISAEELIEYLKSDMADLMNDVKYWEHRIQISTGNKIYEGSRRSWIRSKDIALSKWEYARNILGMLEREENEK